MDELSDSIYMLSPLPALTLHVLEVLVGSADGRKALTISPIKAEGKTHKASGYALIIPRQMSLAPVWSMAHKSATCTVSDTQFRVHIHMTRLQLKPAFFHLLLCLACGQAFWTSFDPFSNLNTNVDPFLLFPHL